MAEPTTILGLQHKWRAMLSPGLDFATTLAISQFVADLEQLAMDTPAPGGDQVALRDMTLKPDAP